MKILGMHCHPDDIEFVMAGTLLLLKEQGHEIHYMNIADGCRGTADYTIDEIRRIRREESIAAAALLGATYHESIAPDMEVFYSDELIRKATAVVRDVAPDIMLIASPQDYMEDHMNSCRLALGGAFVRGMVNYDSIPPRPPIDNDVVIYHAMPHGLTDGLRNPIYPDFYIDVSEVIEKKAEMLACHESQKRWLDRTQGMGSYIETMKELNARVGTMSGSFTYAEGWRRHLHLGYSREDRTPLEELLAGKLKKEK